MKEDCVQETFDYQEKLPSIFDFLFLILGHTLLSTLKIPGLEVFELEQQFNKWWV